MLLAFACFTSGVCLMLLSMNILELPERVVDDVQVKVSKCLSWLCSILPVVTLLSPLVLSGYKIYRYIGLTLLVIVTAPIALLRWYIGRKAEAGGAQAALDEHREQMESAFKFISAISNSASGGLVALVVNYNVAGGSGGTKGSVLAAIFFMFTTAVWGILSMDIRAKVIEIKSTRLRGYIIQALWLAIIIMLLSLACTVSTEVSAMVEFWIFAAFVPWIFASAIYLFLENCIHQSRVARDKTANVYLELEIQLNLQAERGIKVTMWSFMAIIGIFGGFLHGHDKIVSEGLHRLFHISVYVWLCSHFTYYQAKLNQHQPYCSHQCTRLDCCSDFYCCNICHYCCNGFGSAIILGKPFGAASPFMARQPARPSSCSELSDQDIK
jgi:hypothetical protein